MNYFNRNKWWAIAFLVLVALNIATLAAFWILRNKTEGPPPGVKGGIVNFLSKELVLDSAQKLQLEQLIEEHREQVRDIRRNTREAKDSFFALLKEPGVDDTTLANAARQAVMPEMQMDIYTFRHFQKIRSLCNDEQKRKFDAIVQEVLRMNGPAGRPGPPPHGPGHDGPPHGERNMPPPR